MKKLVFVALLLGLGVVAHAECFTTATTVMWFNFNMFQSLDDKSTSEQNAVDIIKKAVQEGYAIEYPAGTRLDEVTKISDLVSAITIGNESTLTKTQYIECR